MATFSHYPWRLMIDCNDYAIISSVKILLEDQFPESSNRHRNCYAVEYFTNENTWKMISNRRCDDYKL